MRPVLNLDQTAVFLTVLDTGSFSAAARKLNRAQSAVTYAIQELEADLRVQLFDRSGYRPALSEAGAALLPKAKRLVHEARTLQAQADGIAAGLEPALSLVIDAMAPIEPLTVALGAFKERFPSVATRVYVESLGAAADMLVDGTADVGLVLALFAPLEGLAREAAGRVHLVAVSAPSHPLAELQALRDAPIERQEAEEHLQLVLTDRSPRTRGADHGIITSNTWRLADLGAKHAMLRAGLGWGSMPRHMVAEDLARGRLSELRLKHWEGTGRMPHLPIIVAHALGASLGPAGRWLFDTLKGRDPADA